MIATLVILQQLSFIQHKNLGYDKEHVLVLPVDGDMSKNYESLKRAFAANAGIVSITGGYESPVNVGWGDGISINNGGIKKDLIVNAMPVDMEYLKTMNIQLAAGSDYTLADLQSIDTSANAQKAKYT